MAVYTDVTAEDLAEFLSSYAIGDLLSYKGVEEGVENSNYMVHTTDGYFFLTLYEKRVAKNDIPFFLHLMDHLSAKGIPCPQPIKTFAGQVSGTLAGKPAAIFNFLEGASSLRPSAAQSGAVGATLAQIHVASQDFSMARPNPLSIFGWRKLFKIAESYADHVQSGLRYLLAKELDHLEENWPENLPTGVIHADLFPDNLFFIKDKVSGVLDFPFACNDFLAYDVAISLNAWCFESDLSFNITKARTMLSSYRNERLLTMTEPDLLLNSNQADRVFSILEEEALPLLARGAAMRFLLTRLIDWQNVPPGAFVKPKDPLEYVRKLRFHQSVKNISDYGFEHSGSAV